MVLLDLAALPVGKLEDGIFTVRVPSYRIVEDGKYALYLIELSVDTFTWSVERRYSEFDALDRYLFTDRKKSFLPPKKLVGNMDPEFLEERRIEIEKYVRALLELEIWQQKKKGVNSLPVKTARFFDFHQYEVHCIVDDLSLRLGKLGDDWLRASETAPKYFEFTPIELYAVSARLRLPEPTAPDALAMADLANTIDFLHRVRSLKVRGCRGYVGNSNIICSELRFSLSFCKSLAALWITDADVSQISEWQSVRSTLRRLVVHYSMKKLEDLLVEEGVACAVADLPTWTALEDADLSFNQLTELHESARVLGGVRRLNLSHNRLTDIGFHLQHLSHLTELDLTSNHIEHMDRWNERLGNVKILRLSGNQITNLHGLCRLYSLEYLDVSENRIADVASMAAAGGLPCLEHIILRGNPVRRVLDYRSKVLEQFGERCNQMFNDWRLLGVFGCSLCVLFSIRVDSRRASEHELDTVSVRLAMRRAREEKEEQERRTQEHVKREMRYISGETDSGEEIASSLRDTL